MNSELKTNKEPKVDILGFLFGFFLFGVPAFVLLFVLIFRWGFGENAVRWVLVGSLTLFVASFGGFKTATNKLYKHD